MKAYIVGGGGSGGGGGGSGRPYTNYYTVTEGACCRNNPPSSHRTCVCACSHKHTSLVVFLPHKEKRSSLLFLRPFGPFFSGDGMRGGFGRRLCPTTLHHPWA